MLPVPRGARSAAVALLVLAATACGLRPTEPASSAPVPPVPAGTTAPAAPAAAPGGADVRIQPPPPCPENASCEGGFVIAGTFYSLSCGFLDPAAVDEEVYATGAGYTVHRVLDVDPAVLLAVPGGTACESPPEVWNLAFPMSGTTPSPALKDAWCRASLQPPDPAVGFACPTPTPSPEAAPGGTVAIPTSATSRRHTSTRIPRRSRPAPRGSCSRPCLDGAVAATAPPGASVTTCP